MTSPPTTSAGRIHWIDDGHQRLGLVPSLGGSAAAWLLHPATAHPGRAQGAGLRHARIAGQPVPIEASPGRVGV